MYSIACFSVKVKSYFLFFFPLDAVFLTARWPLIGIVLPLPLVFEPLFV